MTSKDLDDLEHRLAKGWVIRPDQIKALITVARGQLAAADGVKPADPNVYPSHVPTWSRP